MRQTLRAQCFQIFEMRCRHLTTFQSYERLPINIRHLSVWKIINMQGKNNRGVIALRNLINATKNWANAWVSLVAYSYGWYGISKIYWRTRN